jgi:hypothetical protein
MLPSFGYVQHYFIVTAVASVLRINGLIVICSDAEIRA